MKLLLVVLNKTEYLDTVLKELAENGVSGGTIVNSKGMGTELMRVEEFVFFGSLRRSVNPEHVNNLTLLFALEEAQIELAINCIEKIVGDFNNPDTGVVMVLPLEYVKGIKH